MLSLSDRVLIVDDEEPVRRTLSRILGVLGYKATACESAEEARRLLAEEDFAIAIVDINLGGESGFDVLGEFKHRGPDLEFIMTSGELTPLFPVQAIRGGAVGYLVKPITLEGLKHEMERVLMLRDSLLWEREQRNQLQQELESRTRELLKEHGLNLAFQRSLISSLCRLAEFRDNETGAHLYRMAEYCRELAVKLRVQVPRLHSIVDDLFIHRILYAAPLHDIGKAGMPDSILLKPGPLTPEEFVTMRSHTVIGRDILREVTISLDEKEVGLVKMGMEICASHHEKWDGTGYPEGLKGEDIPLAGRIAALADFYDALSTPRVYRARGLSHQEIKQMVLERSGSHFDPEVVEAFIAAEERILLVRNKSETQIRGHRESRVGMAAMPA